LVVGLGRSGLAAARLAAADGSEVWVTDLREEPELTDEIDTLPNGVTTYLGGHPMACLDGVALVVVSPGVPPASPLLVEAQRRGIPLQSEVEFAWRHRPGARLVAVTGSNGKSTVTELVAQMLREAGRSVAAGGNLGTAASHLVLEGGWEDWVLEVSSFQAELLTAMRPDVAVFLNLSQDHLERHPDLDSYLDAKRNLFSFQRAEDVAVLNADDPAVAATATAASRRLFSIDGSADACLTADRLMLDDTVLTTTEAVALSGSHNIANALAASLAAAALGVPVSAMATTLAGFEGLDHRHRTVHEENGVRWVDDSKATNVGATLAALRGYPDKSVHLILGGQSKGQDFSILHAEIERSVVRIYLIGVDGRGVGEVLAGAAPAENCETLEQAVSRARRVAVSGQWVLLAPACASFDQFSGYDERGDCFAGLAREEAAPCR
jgi:UDP-N-acetylmuramoylalanine--D-glutamate ligase